MGEYRRSKSCSIPYYLLVFFSDSIIRKKKGKAKRKNTEDELARASSVDVEEGPSSKSNKSIADEPKADNMTEAERRFEEIRRRRVRRFSIILFCRTT